MIDKFLIFIFSSIDNLCEKVANLFTKKTKKKKRKPSPEDLFNGH